MKPVKGHEIIVHGIHNHQYFQGCGLSFTNFTGIATGCGDTALAAFDDALDSLCTNDWNVTPVDWQGAPKEGEGETAYDEDSYNYVSVRVR